MGSGKAELHMDSINEMQIKYNDDTWIIQMDKEGLCSLRHNNYVMINERERYITSGFHVQKHHPPYLSGILAYIDGYDWKKHLEVKEDVPMDVNVKETEAFTQEKVQYGVLRGKLSGIVLDFCEESYAWMVF